MDARLRCFGDDGKEGGCGVTFKGDDEAMDSTRSFKMEQFGKEQSKNSSRS